ncbi:hypothetical protein, partial [Phaeovulum veldkampii]|uniref:hypothetical protein n=1 Tax=Phaeovulum veldkampii TaxID=33049 RepID=UPI001A911753
LPDPPQSLYPSFRRPLRFVAFNTTILAHCDAVWGGRQPSHLGFEIATSSDDQRGRIYHIEASI